VPEAVDNELVKLLNKIITDAYDQGVSDIHIEPLPGKGKIGIRFRKDGSLMNYISVPAAYRNAIAARLKIMCDLDISERRKPQDGKIKFKKYGPLDIELRVATIPTAGGIEDVVMRILAAGEPIKLDQLGLAPRNHENLVKCIEKPYGLFFVCGPTGSGKTTTLHSVLGHLNRPDTKIWTAEDPVEITQKGLRQVQINKKAGLDFATIMKAFLRADPDIIMVGEMRDPETTGIGIEASLTGHLVFATLHTNSAPESIIRLLDMGMDPFNFADALLGILAQRLGKRLCKECKEAYQPEADEIEQLLHEYCDELTNTDAWQKDPAGSLAAIRQEWLSRYAKDGQFTLHRARGCPTCNDTGYKGRVGLHELLVGSDPVKRLIQEKARVAQILGCALNEGMRTLKMDGIEKVLQGITDIKQVRAVCIK
ncbi:MAG TPA: GspE/PulE family protein, partial [Azonexus sp.]|nr:GspE/PulE family protein [Azonexus sp.]